MIGLAHLLESVELVHVGAVGCGREMARIAKRGRAGGSTCKNGSGSVVSTVLDLRGSRTTTPWSLL